MIGGRLKFKNAKPATTSLISKDPMLGKRKREEADARQVFDEVVDSGPKLQKPRPEEAKEEEAAEYIEQPIERGLGKLITSGKTVHGFDTNFPSQLAIGDFVILMTEETSDKPGNPKLVEKERRRVNMVLSARSCGLEEPFSEDIQDKSEYWVQRKSKKRERAKDFDEIVRERIGKAETKRQKKEDDEADIGREKLLDMRVKKKTDKFCWF